MWPRLHDPQLISRSGSQRHSVLADVLTIATIAAASAISGAAVSLELAGWLEPLAGIRTAVAHAAKPATPRQEAHARSTAAAGDLSVTAQEHGAATTGVAAGPAASSVAPPPSPRSPGIAEGELTFAWGYAQRHSAVPAANIKARVVAPAARSQRRNVQNAPALAALRRFEQFDGGRPLAMAYSGKELPKRDRRARSNAVAPSFQDAGR